MKTFKYSAITVMALAGIAIAIGQQASKPQPFTGKVETGLVGIALFDPGTKVIARFGSPDDIQALTIGGSGIGAGNSGGGRGGPGGAGSGTPKGGGGGAQAAEAKEDFRPDSGGMLGDPFGTGETFNQLGDPGVGGEGGGGTDAGTSTAKGGGGSAGGGGGATGGSAVTYTRWVYNRNSTRYAFVLDKFNRVLQVEAVGMNNKNVRTKRNIGFGSTFGQIIARYNSPDGYEISGDSIVVRYLKRARVAFKLQRLTANKPHVVTGVVVAAGK